MPLRNSADTRSASKRRLSGRSIASPLRRDLLHEVETERTGRAHQLAQVLDRAVGPHLDVRRLEVAMDDAGLVRGLERFRDLPRDRHRFVERYRPARETLREVVALLASRSKRISRSGSDANDPGRILSATSRSSLASRPR